MRSRLTKEEMAKALQRYGSFDGWTIKEIVRKYTWQELDDAMDELDGAIGELDDAMDELP